MCGPVRPEVKWLRVTRAVLFVSTRHGEFGLGLGLGG